MVEIPAKRADVYQWLLSFKEIKENWLDEVKGERTGSEGTTRTYMNNIKMFVIYTDMTPAEIVAKGTEEVTKETEGVLERKTWADRVSLAFFNWLQEQDNYRGEKWSRSNAKTAYGIARSFLRHNGFTFKGKTPIAQVQQTVKLPSNEQLAEAWKLATPAQKLAAALLRSTMWRPEDILELKFGDLQEQYDPQRFYVEKVTQKEELPVGVYLTAETSEIVRLAARKRYGGKKPDPSDRVLDCDYGALLKIVQRFGENAGLPLSPKYFRKMGRTRCAPVIGQDAVFKMAGWALPGVGRNYVLPSPEDTLKSYLQIENLLTFEPKVLSDKEQRIQSLIDMAIAQGLPMEQAQRMRMIFREKAISVDDATIEIRKALKQVQPAGMLNSEQVAAQQFAKILMMALKQVKEEMGSA